MAMRQLVGELYRCAYRLDSKTHSDGALLDRYTHHGDEAAFEVLVGRLGPMVWGVCRRSLPHQDAEDAFQAVFLVLVRKARSIAPSDKVGVWLFGVANNIVRKAVSVLARRRSREKDVVQLPEPAHSETSSPNLADLAGHVDEAILELPELYREPILFCDVRGMSRKSAARVLGIPEGTLSARLTRGRRLLAERLRQRGLTPAAFAPFVAGIPVPASLLDKTTLALSSATGLSPAAVALSEGVSTMMILTSAKHILACVGLLAVLALGVSLTVLASSSRLSQPTPRTPTKLPADEPREKGPRFQKLDPSVSSVVWGADGRLFVSVETRRKRLPEGEDRKFDRFTTVRIHDAKTGKALRSLGELKNPHFADWQLSPNGKFLALTKRLTIEDGDRVEIWESKTAGLVATFEMDYARSRPAVAFSPDGKLFSLLFGGLQTQKLMTGVRLFDATTGKHVLTLAELGSTGTAQAFSPDGKTLAVGAHSGGKVRLWDVSIGKAIRQFDGVRGSCVSLAFTPDGKTLAASSTAGGLHLWDTATGKPKPALDESPSTSVRVAISPDGRYLAAGSRMLEDGQLTWKIEVRVWDLRTRKKLLELSNATRSMAFSPDSRTLRVLVPDKGIRLVSIPNAN